MKKLLTLIFLFLSFLDAQEVKVVFSYSTPPYVFTDGSGIVVTIVKESLAYKKHTLKPVFVNIGRSFEMFRNGYVDATSIIKENSGLNAYYSDDFMQYHNAAFALKSKHYNIATMEDLSDYYFICFQNASIYLGERFGNVAAKAGKKYSEVADQKQQVYMLLKGRTDVVVIDRHIFKYYKNELIVEGKVSKDIETEMFDLLEPTKYRTAFKDEKLRDDFNEGVAFLKKSGRYEAIYEEYSDKFFEVKR
ncbi:MAG: transporter substrate-binding domain-containing protein [Sulfurimonas sp.]|nr:transporter substrate-binding domain-containing protein [Sulfurimonas sp.]